MRLLIQTLISSLTFLGFAPFCLADEPRIEGETDKIAFFESKIRPLLIAHCYECHSEERGEQQGGLLLDRQSGWLEGGTMGKAVLPENPGGSLLLTAIRYDHDELQMPPDGPLAPDVIKLFEKWIELGATGPAEDLGESEFSRLGDQEFLFGQAATHWAFQPVVNQQPPEIASASWHRSTIDPFVSDHLAKNHLSPSKPADPSTIARRLHFALTGLPPTFDRVQQFVETYRVDKESAVDRWVEQLIGLPSYGEHMARMWLDVARYADTDSTYRPDTRTPYYFPFAFTYRDYVVDSFNADKPYDQFIKEQLAADLMGYKPTDPEIRALGFLSIAPHANRATEEALDDWIDATTRGLLGVTVACARCHDHKFEPVPTADYYSLRGVFASMQRIDELDEKKQPLVAGYFPTQEQIADYEAKRKEIDAKIAQSVGLKTGGNNRSVTDKIRETELAQLLTFHPGAPARAMVVRDLPKPASSYIFVRGDSASKGEQVARRFLKVLDPVQEVFPDDNSGRLSLAEKIADPKNPLTARVIVNRVWGHLFGSYLVDTPSDFGLQGSPPSHPELLDWLAADFMNHHWSIKHLVRQIVTSQTFLQSSDDREDAVAIDPENRLLWRANRKHLSVEMLRDSILLVSNQLDRTPRGRAGEFWGENYTRRRALYGFVNRFNLDPTLRAFDFPTPMQSQGSRDESIVAQQALFTMNSHFVIDQSVALITSIEFQKLENNEQRIGYLFQQILQREPSRPESVRIEKFLDIQRRLASVAKPAEPSTSEQVTSDKDTLDQATITAWPLIAQSLMMSNEFQYIE